MVVVFSIGVVVNISCVVVVVVFSIGVVVNISCVVLVIVFSIGVVEKKSCVLVVVFSIGVVEKISCVVVVVVFVSTLGIFIWFSYSGIPTALFVVSNDTNWFGIPLTWEFVCWLTDWNAKGWL